MTQPAAVERPRAAGDRIRAFLPYALAIGLAVAVYLPGLPGEFVYDDHRLITDNEGLRRPLDLRRAFLRDYYASDTDRMGLGYYRPVAILSNEFDFRRGGGRALPFHLTNLLVHAACATLVVALARRVAPGARGAAPIAGALFALHPAHAETVAFISGRVDALATLFGLATVLLYLQGASSSGPWRWRFGAALAWLAALLSKEVAVTVPVLAVCAEVARGTAPGPRAWKQWAERVAPFALVLVPYLILRRVALGGLLGAATGSVEGRFLRIPVVLGSYLSWLVLPPPGIHLEPATPAGGAALVAGAVLAVTIAACAVLLRRRRRAEAALLAWCAVALLPVAQLRPIETELSERFLYLPSVGACVLVGLLASRASGRAARAAAIAAVIVLGIAYAAILVPRSRIWRDEVALWSANAREDPSSLKAQLNLGRACARRGDVAGATHAYETAAALSPQNAAAARAELESLTGGEEGASEASIRLALETLPTDAALWNNLGFALLQKGRNGEAADAFTRAVALVPSRSRAWLGLALAELRRGDVERAIEAARRCLALNPNTALARLVLGESALRQGMPCEAIREMEGTVFDTPEETSARDRLLAIARQRCEAPP